MFKSSMIFYMFIIILFIGISSKEELKSKDLYKKETNNKENDLRPTNYNPEEDKKLKLPENKILLPIRRSGTSKSLINSEPCGGIEKTLANTLVNKGSQINFVWETITPDNKGKCMVRISPGGSDPNDFRTLYPIDNSSNEDGLFNCSREIGFENKEFTLPADYECDGCTLQFKWVTSKGNMYSCSDIIINGDLISECINKCQNGGSCFNGKCLCPKGYTGTYCDDSSSSSKVLLVLLILLALLAAAGAIYYFFFYGPKSKSWISGGPNSVRPAFGGDVKNKPNTYVSSNFD